MSLKEIRQKKKHAEKQINGWLSWLEKETGLRVINVRKTLSDPTRSTVISGMAGSPKRRPVTIVVDMEDI